MNLSFDLISDLNLTPGDKFVWEGKVTSLFCVIPGNISSDLAIVKKTLTYLAELYQGIFYIDGATEHLNIFQRSERITQLEKICKNINNTVYLHDNVIIVNGVAILGINGWYGNYTKAMGALDSIRLDAFRQEDLVYLHESIKRMQLHPEVKHILILSASVPSRELYFGEHTAINDSMSPTVSLLGDTEKKVTHWAFAGSNKKVDVTINDINYLSNPRTTTEPYWAKCIPIN